MTKKLSIEEMTQSTDDLKYNNIINQDNSVNDEISLIAISELLNDKKLKTISRIKMDQVAILTKLYLFSNIFGDNFTKKIADLILKLQISVSGLGRKELVQMIQQRIDIFDPNQVKKSKDIFRWYYDKIYKNRYWKKN